MHIYYISFSEDHKALFPTGLILSESFFCVMQSTQFDMQLLMEPLNQKGELVLTSHVCCRSPHLSSSTLCLTVNSILLHLVLCHYRCV